MNSLRRFLHGKARRLACLALVLTLCAGLCGLPAMAEGGAPDASVTSYDELLSAMGNAPEDGTEYVIELADSFDIPTFLGPYKGQNVTLISAGEVTLTATGRHTGGSVTFNGHFIVLPGATLTLTDGITLTGARGAYSVQVNGGTFNMPGGVISGNENADIDRGLGGGVHILSGGTFNMTGGKISQNSALRGDGSMPGGGVRVDGGTFNMSGDAEISDNKAESGGGVAVSDGAFNMTGNAVITGNKTGGGVYFGGADKASSFYMGGKAKITNNDCWVGAGVSFSHQIEDVSKTFTMTDDAEISGNTAGDTGGGIAFSGTELNISGNAKISGNKAAAEGAGVRVYVAGVFNLSGNASISGNSVTGDLGKGGGIWSNTAAVNLSGDASISGNSATYGGGVYNSSASFTMTGGEITGNTANYFGGGVLNDGGGTVSMDGGKITGNTATLGSGGGVYNEQTFSTNKCTFSLKSGEISGNNTAAQFGGGVFNGDTFTMADGKISGNNTGYYGGGVCNNGGGKASVTGGEISGNTAGYYGGGAWNGPTTQTNKDDFSFTVTGGTIKDNTAKDGGGIFTLNYSKLTVGAAAVFSGNKADALYALTAEHTAYMAAYKETVAVPDYSWSVAGAQYGYNSYDINFNQLPVIPVYTVTYLPGEHGTFEAVSHSAAAGAKTPDAPQITGESGWTFTGWDKELAETVTGDAIYTAQWKKESTPPPPDTLTPAEPAKPSESPATTDDPSEPSDSPDTSDTSDSSDPSESPEPTDGGEDEDDEEDNPPPPQITPGGKDPAAPPVPNLPERTVEQSVSEDGDVIYVEIGDDGTPRGEWSFDEDAGEWIFDEYPPLSDIPKTGDEGLSAWLILLLGTALAGAAAALGKKRRSTKTGK